MIRIDKGPAPRKLTDAGTAMARMHCAAYDLDPAPYITGLKNFEIAVGIFAHRSVKESLERSQHGKCCYCEAFIEKPYAHSHVEHWRPKAFSQQDAGGEKF